MKVLLYASCLISLFLTLFSLTEEKNIEIIIHLDNDPNMKEYNAMVREVNATEVAPEEELSDHA